MDTDERVAERMIEPKELVAPHLANEKEKTIASLGKFQLKAVRYESGIH